MLKIFEFVAGKGKTPDYDDYEPVVKGKAKGKSGKTGKSKEEPPPLRHRSQCVCALRAGLPRLGILVSSCLAFLRASKGKGKGKEPVEEPKGKGKAKGKGKGKAGAVRLSGITCARCHIPCAGIQGQVKLPPELYTCQSSQPAEACRL